MLTRLRTRFRGWLWFNRYRTPIWQLRKAIWWVRHRTTDRYDRIYIKSLTPGYYDCDTLMLHGIFELIRRFVEDEHGGRKSLDEFSAELESRAETSSNPGEPEALLRQARFQRDVVDLYDWWRTKRPLRQDPLDVPYRMGRQLEQLYENEDTEMMCRAVRLRTGLWT